jgi:hypothetical protein
MVSGRMTWQEALARLDVGRAPERGDAVPGIARPASLELIGRAIAERLGSDVDLVLTWYKVDDSVLGHIVARELGVDNAFIIEPAEGQLRFDRAPLSGQRVALIGVEFDQMSSVRAPAAMVASCGAELSQVIALVSSPVLKLEDKSTFVVMSAG